MTKIFADANGIPTPNANLGFLQRPNSADPADVLAVYRRLDLPNAVEPADFTDVNWINGIATFGSALILKRATSIELGYASNELAIGQSLHFPNGEVRNIINIVPQEKFVQVYFDGGKIDGSSLHKPIHIGVYPPPSDYQFVPYPQQYGLTAVFLSGVNKWAPALFSVKSAQFFYSFISAVCIVAISVGYWRGVSRFFSVVFLICMLGSPWFTSVARNLYFAPFLWLLPSVFSIGVYNSKDYGKDDILYCCGYFFSIFLKSLCGYEYLSTIVLFSLFPFFVDPFRAVPRRTLLANLEKIVIIGILTISAFFIAFLIHANMRSESILDGIRLIFVDAQKYSGLGGNIKMPGYDKGLVSVLDTYIFSWSTPVIFWLDGSFWFPFLIFLSSCSIVIQFYNKSTERYRDCAIMVAAFLPPLSWFFLQRGHSVIHVHLNYVLWYFCFVPAIVFVSLRGVEALWGLSRRAISRATAGRSTR